MLEISTKNNILKSNPPCDKCPYKLGIIKTLTNPCPHCKITGYSTYKQFLKQPDKQIKHDR